MNQLEKKNKMFECPYAEGLSCNQKDITCDKGKFTPFCLMGILRMVNQNVSYKHELLRREGIQMACHILLHSHFLKEKYMDCCTDDIRDKVILIIEGMKSKGKEWFDI